MSSTVPIPNDKIQYSNNVETKITFPKLAIGLFITGGVCLAIGIVALVANLVLPGGLFLAIGIATGAAVATDLSVMFIMLGVASVLGGITKISSDAADTIAKKEAKELSQETIAFILSIEEDPITGRNVRRRMAAVNRKLQEYLYSNDQLDQNRACALAAFIQEYKNDSQKGHPIYAGIKNRMNLITREFKKIMKQHS